MGLKINLGYISGFACKAVMEVWKLEVEVDGEREGCYFSSSEDADRAFQMLLADYGLRLSSAKLTSPNGKLLKARAVKQPEAARNLWVDTPR